MADDRHAELKREFYEKNKGIVANHGAAIMTFCVMNDIDISEGLEIANEIFALIATDIIKGGIYDKVKEDYKEELDLLKKLQGQQDNGRVDP